MHTTAPATDTTGYGREIFFQTQTNQKLLYRSSSSTEELSGLAVLLIQNERAKNLDFRKVTQHFAGTKAGPQIFN